METPVGGCTTSWIKLELVGLAASQESYNPEQGFVLCVRSTSTKVSSGGAREGGGEGIKQGPG